MPTLALVSPEPNAGLATIAAGLSRIAGESLDITTIRGQDAQPPADVRTVLVVTPATAAEGAVARVRAASLAGVIVNHVPERRMEAVREEYEGLGVKPLAVVPEDRLLASPTVGQLADALGATGELIDENREQPLARPVIASIAADPGQSYYDRLEAQSVIVRADKPDLQLSALNAGARCLIVTGDLPILSYVLERVREDEIPLLRTSKDTKETVAALEDLFGAAPFEGEEKARRIAELLSGAGVDEIVGRAANPA